MLMSASLLLALFALFSTISKTAAGDQVVPPPDLIYCRRQSIQLYLQLDTQQCINCSCINCSSIQRHIEYSLQHHCIKYSLSQQWTEYSSMYSCVKCSSIQMMYQIQHYAKNDSFVDILLYQMWLNTVMCEIEYQQSMYHLRRRSPN